MSFEDREMAMLVLKKMLFQSFYTWIVALFRLPVSNFSEFLSFVFRFLYYKGFSCILPMY
jgi:hypothetical protein